jgi:hypothetical protein
MHLLMMLILVPLLALAPGLSVRPIPLRVDASDRIERFAQQCRRTAFFLMAIPALVMCVIIGLLIYRFSGGEGLLAFRKSLSIAGWLWRLSSVVGISCGIGACFDSDRRSDGYKFIASHAMLLFLVMMAPQLEYAGHPD